MVFEEGLVTVGRYPDKPIHVQDMEKSPFVVGDAVINKSVGGAVFIVAEEPYRFVYARRPPPDPFYIDWFIKLDNGAEVSADVIRKATRKEVTAAIEGLRKTVATVENKINHLERYNERALN